MSIAKHIDSLSQQELEFLYLKTQAWKKIKCEENYYHFFLQAWKELEPVTPLVPNWHIKYLCDILQREVERIVANKSKLRDIIINIAPRSGKSYIVTVMLTPWIWTRFPHFKIINSSYSMDLSTKLCLDSRRLINSDWYRNFWGYKFKLCSDMNVKSWYENDRGGMRKSTSTGAAITGTGADILILDDPQNPMESDSETEREAVKIHYGRTLYSRLNNQKTGLRIIIQQRLHEEDLTGHLMSNDPQSYEHICIPVELTDDVCPTKLKKFYLKGLFDPVRFSGSILASARLPTNLGAYGYSGQMLQRPSPEEGGLFKRHWWRFWRPQNQNVSDVYFKDANGNLKKSEIVELPDKFDQILDSWDTALEGKVTSDDVVGGKWALKGQQKFLLDQIKGKLDFPQTKKAVKKLWNAHPDTSTIIIEKSSNGPAVAADLKTELPSIILIPTGRLSKEDRVRLSDTVPYTAQAEAGNIILPHPEIAPWVHGFINEHAAFPKTAQDGQVDQSSQAVNYLTTCKFVWNYYQPGNPMHHRAFKMRRHKPVEYIVNIGGIFLAKDMRMSFLCCEWDREERHLYVYGELVASRQSLRKIADNILKGMGALKGRRIRGIYCNAGMLKDNKKSTAELLNKELQGIYRSYDLKAKSHIVEPYQYDRSGSISLINLLFHSSAITVHTATASASRQFGSWYIDNNQPATEGFELCEALTQIVSELNRSEPLRKPVSHGLPDYPALKMEKDEKPLSWMAK